jgi:hypothetical protein
LEVYRPVGRLVRWYVLFFGGGFPHDCLPVVEQPKRQDPMHERPEIPNQRRAVHEQLERHRGVLAIILLDKVPYHEADGSDDERGEDVRGVPCELLTAPDEAHDKDSKGVATGQ